MANTGGERRIGENIGEQVGKAKTLHVNHVTRLNKGPSKGSTLASKSTQIQSVVVTIKTVRRMVRYAELGGRIHLKGGNSIQEDGLKEAGGVQLKVAHFLTRV